MRLQLSCQRYGIHNLHDEFLQKPQMINLTKDYSEIANKFRPGHADFTYQKKYGIRDYRGGGRSSARETAVRVAAGAIADIVLKKIIGKKSDFKFLNQGFCAQKRFVKFAEISLIIS